MRPWWSNATVAEYQKRTDCFVKQYGDYFLPEVDMNVSTRRVACRRLALAKRRKKRIFELFKRGTRDIIN